MNLQNSVLLFLNGVPPSRQRIQTLVRHPAGIVCADGGAHRARSIGLEPDLIVGDLDSLDGENDAFDKAEIVRISSQDNTDFEKTLDFILERGMDNFLVTSFSGGRLDQTLANIQIAYEYSRKCHLVLADDEYLIVPVVRGLTENVRPDTQVSLVSMEDETIISTSGLAYELNRSRIPKGGHGISNRTTGTRMEIEVHEGGILVFIRSI